MKIWGKTDRGLVRASNQDAFLIEKTGNSENTAFFVVCDGMGGANAGHIASKMAIEAFGDEMKASVKPSMSKNYIKNILKTAVTEANRRVFEAAEGDTALSGMGTTLVGACVSGENCAVVNIGDSRCYLVDESAITRVTHDHSLVEELVMRGELTAAEAMHHPNKNLITRALGAEREANADVFTPETAPGKFILLCSDGLTNMVSEQEILYEIIHGGESRSACSRLIDLANRRGGGDNITVVLAEL